jgi:4-carboxymuconolactone decarboxylase
MARLQPIVPERLDDDQRTMYDNLVGGPRKGTGLIAPDGSLRGPFDPLLRTPDVGDAVQRLGAKLRFSGRLAGDLRELAVLVTAVHVGCSFELAAHAPLAVAEGVPSAAVDAIRSGGAPDLADARQIAVHAAVLELVRSPKRCLSAASVSSLRTLLGEDQLVELVVVVGYYALLAQLLESFEITMEMP